MTLINKLISQAKQTPKPKELLIYPHQVIKIAQHAKTLQFWETIPIEMYIREIKEGRCYILGIPVRVIKVSSL